MRRLARWIDQDFHRYGTNALLLLALIYTLAASFNYVGIR